MDVATSKIIRAQFEHRNKTVKQVRFILVAVLCVGALLLGAWGLAR